MRLSWSYAQRLPTSISRWLYVGLIGLLVHSSSSSDWSIHVSTLYAMYHALCLSWRPSRWPDRIHGEQNVFLNFSLININNWDGYYRRLNAFSFGAILSLQQHYEWLKSRNGKNKQITVNILFSFFIRYSLTAVGLPWRPIHWRPSFLKTTLLADIVGPCVVEADSDGRQCQHVCLGLKADCWCC